MQMDQFGATPRDRSGVLMRFFKRENPTYDRWQQTCQGHSRLSKAIYLVLYLIPGMIAAIVINVPAVFFAELRVSHLSPRYLQFGWLLVITLGWHLLSPFVFLRLVDRLTFRESLSFLGLSRIDVKGLLVVLPVFCVGFALVSVPYMQFAWNPLSALLQKVPLFHVPRWSIFGGDPAGLYAFPAWALAFLFVGNFLGEELYFRGYLMKKSSFLGPVNWLVNPLLFAIYHLWQIPFTWPLIGLVLAFGLLMWLRKDLYVMIAFHFFVNMWLTYGEYPLAKLLHLAR
jgi:membrane protease YdiL (CAAX protease family)